MAPMRCYSTTWHLFYILCSISAQQAFLTAIYTSLASQIGSPTEDIPIPFTGTDSPTIFTGTGSFTAVTGTDTPGPAAPTTPATTYRPPVVTARTNTNSVGTSTLIPTAPTSEIVANTPTMSVTAVPQTAPSSGGRSNRTGPIVGGIVGGIGGLLAILITIWFCWYRSRRRAALAANPYTNQEVRHARRTGPAITTEVISRGHIPAAGGVVPGPIPSGDSNVRQYPSSPVPLGGGALEEGRAAPATSGLPPTPSSGRGTCPAAPPPQAPFAEGRVASRQHGEGGHASSLGDGGGSSAM
ncbi:hypothetical protein BC826DRAFT_1108797 [Russula brevipes]|nr:hypothetical protein BC826DRAFT_1108797 [Russula brevipes]